MADSPSRRPSSPSMVPFVNTFAPAEMDEWLAFFSSPDGLTSETIQPEFNNTVAMDGELNATVAEASTVAPQLLSPIFRTNTLDPMPTHLLDITTPRSTSDSAVSVLSNASPSPLTSDMESMTTDGSRSAAFNPPPATPLQIGAMRSQSKESSSPRRSPKTSSRPILATSLKRRPENLVLSCLRQRLALQLPGITSQPVHVPTMLVEYWFKRVCPAMSAYDSQNNPFRRNVDRLFRNSASLYNAMLSTAAACSYEQLPHLVSADLANITRVQAIQALREEFRGWQLQRDDANLRENILMSCFLLGMSSSWLNGKDLGMEFFRTARFVMQHRTGDGTDTIAGESLPAERLIEDGLPYWEMLILAGSGGVEDPFLLGPESRQVSQSPQTAGTTPSPVDSRTGGEGSLPFPISTWPPAENLLARALALTKQQRQLCRTGQLSNKSDLMKALENIQKAQALEELILECEVPTEEEIQETGDPTTPSAHIVHLADAIRTIALLQLYRTFPDLITNRLGSDLETSVSNVMASLVISVVDLLRGIAPSSGIRCMLPVLLVMVASELVFETLPDPDCQSQDFTDWTISKQDVSISKARSFVLDRLCCFERCLPARPVTNAIRLVREMWARLDRGEDVFWMDVMVETKLAAIFC